MEIRVKNLFGFRDVFGHKAQSAEKFFFYALAQEQFRFTPFSFIRGEFGTLMKERHIIITKVFPNAPEALWKKNFDFRSFISIH